MTVVLNMASSCFLDPTTITAKGKGTISMTSGNDTSYGDDDSNKVKKQLRASGSSKSNIYAEDEEEQQQLNPPAAAANGTAVHVSATNIQSHDGTAGTGVAVGSATTAQQQIPGAIADPALLVADPETASPIGTATAAGMALVELTPAVIGEAIITTRYGGP
eukprot:CAMPEP_0194444314 /NCGR_PEP_ID=MMETSP0176-20130528/127204_1 /TAXON_ID=216777 /ORGANISM="Proboscia alata, Strain PI-D3" /LENGTH=161 /DNA_ID=CAMNT_0039270679 /DNA_START=170 /DNA_END=658 /DNA_ORIENTATION=+